VTTTITEAGAPASVYADQHGTVLHLPTRALATTPDPAEVITGTVDQPGRLAEFIDYLRTHPLALIGVTLAAGALVLVAVIGGWAWLGPDGSHRSQPAGESSFEIVGSVPRR
jgi:hypothetical protein